MSHNTLRNTECAKPGSAGGLHLQSYSIQLIGLYIYFFFIKHFVGLLQSIMGVKFNYRLLGVETVLIVKAADNEC